MRRNESPKKFANDLLKRAQKCSRLFRRGAKQRTEAVRGILSAMAYSRGLKFSPRRPRKRHEFLCDFAWMCWQKSHPLWLRRLVLAAECEWSNQGRDRSRQVLYDFRKLLPLKARFKLCIYQVRRRSPEGLAEKLRKKAFIALEGYQDHTPGECYLLLELDRRKEPTARIYQWHLGMKRFSSLP